jgi:hypothetical protein
VFQCAGKTVDGVVVVVAADVAADVPEPTEPVVGGGEDEHGCCATCGETWCEHTRECAQEWVTPCVAVEVEELECVFSSCCHPEFCVPYDPDMEDCSEMMCSAVAYDGTVVSCEFDRYVRAVCPSNPALPPLTLHAQVDLAVRGDHRGRRLRAPPPPPGDPRVRARLVLPRHVMRSVRGGAGLR